MLARASVCAAIFGTILAATAAQAGSKDQLIAVSAVERLERLQASLREARGRSDWDSYLTVAQQIKGLLNGSPQSRLELARAEIHAGHANAAVAEVSAYVRMGQASEVLDNVADFAPLRQRRDFKSLRTSMLANRQVVSRSTLAFHVPDPGILPEDIDFDSRANRFFISSILQHRIVSITSEGSMTEFGSAPDGWPVLAIKIDGHRRLLWATEVAIEGFAGISAANQGRSALLCYDLNSGNLLQRIEGPRPSALGDMGLTAQGDVIVSDGSHGGLYRLKSGEHQLERLNQRDFVSPQTIVMAADGVHAYVPDYVRGLGVLDFKTQQVRWIPMAERFALDGIDGLYRVGDQLIAVQNGSRPERVVVFSMNAGATRIVAEQVIERATQSLGDPTHGVMVGDSFYYIANSGWDALGPDGLLRPGATMTRSAVMKWRLPRLANRNRTADVQPPAFTTKKGRQF